MKLSIALLAASIVKAQAEEIETDRKCFTKVDCKVLRLTTDAIQSGKLSECMNINELEDISKCTFKALGLNKDQADLAWKLGPHAKKCTPEVDTEFDTCTAGCTGKNDREDCLETCALPLKVKGEECFEKLAGVPTENATKNALCMADCNKDTYAEIFQCQYECRKDVVDALVIKCSSQ